MLRPKSGYAKTSVLKGRENNVGNNSDASPGLESEPNLSSSLRRHLHIQCLELG